MKKELALVLIISLIVFSIGCTTKLTERNAVYEDENISLTYPDWKPLELSENQLVKVSRENEEFALIIANVNGSSVLFGKKFEETNFGHQNYVANITGIGNVRGNELYVTCGLAVTFSNISYYECLGFVSCNQNIYTILHSKRIEFDYSKKIFDDALESFECREKLSAE